jgi:ADP-ribose pyrophosphatase YjhB (NUDIX family)
MGETPNTPSFSGQTRCVESIILLNPSLKEERVRSAKDGCEFNFLVGEQVVVPKDHRAGGAETSAYGAYRQGLDSACVDIVVTTRLPNDKSVVLAIKRNQNVCFGGKWWMMGGALHSYRPIAEFIKERAAKECGVEPRLEGCIGVFRTAARDVLACTINICLVGYVDYPYVAQKFKPDDAHSGHRLLTVEDLKGLPEEEKHWYPMLCFEQALDTM